MTGKTAWEIDGKRWIRIADAAKLLNISAARVREMMGNETLDWRQLRMGSTTFLVDERAVALLCQARQTELKAAATRARRSLPTARQRGTSLLDRSPSSAPYNGIFVRTWDPSPGPEGLARGRRVEPDDESTMD